MFHSRSFHCFDAPRTVEVAQAHHRQLDQRLFDYDVVKELEMNPKAMHQQDCLHRVRMMSSPW
jgi:adenylate kinase family enzyme